MRIKSGYILIAASMIAPATWGQGLFDQLNFRNAENAGFGLYGASLFAGYTGYGSTSLGQPPSNVNYGAGFSAGWQHHRTNTNASLLYTGTYDGLVRYPEFNSYDQALSIGARWQLSRKWTFVIGGSAQDYSLSESLFAPSSLGITSGVASSFDDFAAALGVGQFSTSQAQSLFDGTFLESAIRSGLLGGRVLSYGANASLTYAYSPNAQVHFSSFDGGGRRLGGSGDTTVQPNYAMPQSLGSDAGIGLTHSFSPRTQVGLNLDESFIHSLYRETALSTATASFGRKMTSHSFIHLYGGGSYTQDLQSTVARSRGLQAVGGGALGFQGQTQTLALTYDRSAASGFGFSVGTNTTMMASWNRHRTGSRLNLFSSFGEQQQRNTGFLSISGWDAAAGLSVNLSSQISVSAQYAYLDTTANYPGANTYLVKTNSARLALNWTPRRVLR